MHFRSKEMESYQHKNGRWYGNIKGIAIPILLFGSHNRIELETIFFLLAYNKKDDVMK